MGKATSNLSVYQRLWPQWRPLAGDDPAFLATAFLGMVHTRTSTVWMSLVGKEVNFKLDTGAEVTAISDSIYQILQGV